MSHVEETWRDASRLRRAEQALRTLLHMLEMRVPSTRGRAQRITDGCCVLAEIMGCAESERVGLSLAARFHCVGALGVPDSILLKPTFLTPAEKETFDTHHVLGGRLVSDLVPDFPEAVEAIWWYQERPDGRGPNHMTAAMIPLHASILGLVVALEAMANDRPYRAAIPLDRIRQELDRGAGTQFDGAVVAAFRGAADAVYAAVAPRSAMRGIASPAGPVPASKAVPARAASTRAEPAAAAPRTAAPGAPTRIGFVRGSALLSESLAALSPLVRKEELLQLIAKGLHVRPLAPVVQQILGATGRASCSVEEIAKLVQQEQTLALRVLQLASSSAYNRGRPPENLQAAVTRLGIHQVRELVTGLGVMTNYDAVVSKHLSANGLWEHSLATGLLAGAIMGAQSRKPSGDPFLWGMLHDVGRLILASQLPDAYAKVWDAADNLDAPLEAVEGKLMMLDHCEVLAMALEHWRFSSDLVAPIIHHHKSAANLNRLGGALAREAAAVALADRLAHALVLGNSGNDTLYPLAEIAALAGAPAGALQQIAAEMPMQVNDLRFSLMCHGHVNEWVDAAAAVREKLPATFRPLLVDLEPTVNPFRLFCPRVTGDDRYENPTLGLLYLRDALEKEHGIARFAAAEQTAGAKNLPLLVFWEKGRFNPDDAWLRQRRHIAMQMPVRIPTFIRAVQALLGPEPALQPAPQQASDAARPTAKPTSAVGVS